MESYIQINKNGSKPYKRVLDIVQTIDKTVKASPSDTSYLKNVTEIWRVEEDKRSPGKMIKTCIFQKAKIVEIVTELGNDPKKSGEKYNIREDDVPDGDTPKEDRNAVNLPVDSEKFVIVSQNTAGEDIIWQ